jgi:hypothetical protein
VTAYSVVAWRSVSFPRRAIKDAEVSQGTEVVLPQPSESVLEISFRPVECRVIIEGEDACIINFQKFGATNHCPAVAAVISIAESMCMANSDEGEKTFRTAQNTSEFVEGVVRVALLKRPYDPRME